MELAQKLEEVRSNYSSREEAIQEIDKTLNRLYKIKFYHQYSEPNHQLEYSLQVYYRFKIHLLNLPDWPAQPAPSKSILDKIKEIILLIISPTKWYPLIKNKKKKS